MEGAIESGKAPIATDHCLSPDTIRTCFLTWLSNGHSEKYSPEVVISCIDKISDYAVSKKKSEVGIWEYTHPTSFQALYEKLTKTKLLRITDRNTYKVFITVGQLYLNFLEERSFVHKANVAICSDKKEMNSYSNSMVVTPAINPDDVITWLVTQPNANGTLYIENVVRQYMGILRTAPGKLELPLADIESVFNCHTPSDLNKYWEIFKTAPNYKQVNRSTSGMFSAGLNCYMRYLQHLENSASVEEPIIRETKQQLSKDIGEDDVNIACTLKDDAPPQFMHTELQSINEGSEHQSKPEIDNSLIIRLTDILSTNFSNGFRLDSPIEMMRFRSSVASSLGDRLTLSDDDLKAYIAACGMSFEGKVYVVSAEVQERIKEIIDNYFANGAQVIFFSEFYAKNENWLFGASIISEGMLIEILRSLFPEASFTRTYFGNLSDSISAVLESEILRVWSDESLNTYDQLAERLTYIPLDRIKYELGQNRDFIWNSVGTFSHISQIEINEEEVGNISSAAFQECNSRGYVSITDLPFGEIAERNYELSITAVHNAVYRVCLADKFDKKGKIVTRKGDVLDALTIMKEHCRTIDKCSLDDLQKFERELTGEVHRWIPMEAGNSILIRIDKNTYVADRYVQFDVDRIDRVIDLMVRDRHYLPLMAFTTFSTFPDCGQAWNLFLLESYCRRFSRKFRFDALSVNSRNAGAVIRASCVMNYMEIMADAVASSETPLTETSAGRFLFENGYIGRSSTVRIAEILYNARAKREGRD